MNNWNFQPKFDQFERVIIDSAEVEGNVLDIVIDTQMETELYFVRFNKGEVYQSCFGYGDYEDNTGWFTPDELRKLSSKKSLWQIIFG